MIPLWLRLPLARLQPSLRRVSCSVVRVQGRQVRCQRAVLKLGICNVVMVLGFSDEPVPSTPTIAVLPAGIDVGMVSQPLVAGLRWYVSLHCAWPQPVDIQVPIDCSPWSAIPIHGKRILGWWHEVKADEIVYRHITIVLLHLPLATYDHAAW